MRILAFGRNRADVLARRRAGNFSLLSMFMFLFALRGVTEGIDHYLGTPVSIILTSGIIILSLVILIGGRCLFSTKHLILISASSLFLLSASFSIILSSEIPLGGQISKLIQYVLYVLVFLVAATAPWKAHHVRTLLVAFMLLSGIELLFSIYQFATGSGMGADDFDIRRSFGLMSHPTILSVKIILILLIFFLFRDLLSGYAWIIMGIFSAISIALTFSRVGWIFGILFIGFYTLSFAKGAVKGFMIAIAAPLLIYTLIASGRFDDLSTTRDFIESGNYQSFRGEQIENSFDWRLVQWYHMINVGFERPFSGHGLASSSHLNQFHLSSHNSFIDIFVDQGYFGLFTLLTFLGTMFAIPYKNIKYISYNVVDYKGSRLILNTLFLGSILIMSFAMSLFNQLFNMATIVLILGFLSNTWSPQRTRQLERDIDGKVDASKNGLISV